MRKALQLILNSKTCFSLNFLLPFSSRKILSAANPMFTLDESTWFENFSLIGHWFGIAQDIWFNCINCINSLTKLFMSVAKKGRSGLSAWYVVRNSWISFTIVKKKLSFAVSSGSLTDCWTFSDDLFLCSVTSPDLAAGTYCTTKGIISRACSTTGTFSNQRCLQKSSGKLVDPVTLV